MAEMSAEALARRLYTALEIGDAAAVRRALADGADPERGPAEEFGTRPLMQLLVNMEIANQMNKHPDAPDWEKRYHKPGADPVACCAALEFWAHAGDYCMPFCMPFGPETLVRRGLELIAARVANGNVVVASHK